MRSMTIRRSAIVAMAATGLAMCGAVQAVAAEPAADLDRNGPAGLDLTRAWTLTRGAPTSVIGYVEGGINWHLPSAQHLSDHSYLNWRELPVPCATACPRVDPGNLQDVDTNHDGVATVADWAGDPRVTDTNGNGFVDPEDLLVAFRDGRDADRNGFPDDVSGWDFYDDQPDPATVDATYGHANGQMENALRQCPDCLVLPVKAGAEALDATDRLAQAWMYAAQQGVSVITSVTADLGYSSFMRHVVDRLAARGVAMVESSNDFDSTDHQGGMFWPGVVPGNGAVVDPTGQRWVRASETSWGTHSMFTIPGESSTSAATSATGGLVGLLMAWGQQEYAARHVNRRLTGQQAVQILRETATPVTDPTLGWPGSPGEWNLQYGYGIPNMYRAMLAVSADQAPPVGALTAPDWYTMVDPARTDRVPVRGRVAAPAGTPWTFELQVGYGPQPSSFTTIATGRHTGPWAGWLGTLRLDQVPEALWRAPMAISTAKDLPTAEQYAVTLRLVVRDDAGRTSVDRRAVYAHHDPALAAGYPWRLRSSGESQPALVDLTGTGRLSIVVGTADGLVHAIDPVSRRDLPGWPVATDRVRVHRSYPGIDTGHEPILANVAVGDVRGNGNPIIVATSMSGRVYAWDRYGRRLPGWPRVLNTGVEPPPIPRPALPFTRLPVMGALAAPVLADLRRTGELAVVQAGWDGHLHAFDVDGGELPGWPVRVQLPAGATPAPGYQLINDQKLEATPAVAYLDGPDQPPSLVLRSQFSETRGPGLQFVGFGHVFAYGPDGTLRPGWPARVPTVIVFYGSAQEFITEGSSSAVAADVTGTGADLVAVSPVFSVPLLLDGAGQVVGAYGIPNADIPRLSDPAYLGGLIFSGTDLPIAFTTSGSFGRVGGTLRFVQAGSGIASLASALLNDNAGLGIRNYETAYPAAGGTASPGFPALRQGLDFLGSPIVADVDSAAGGDTGGEIVDGGDSNVMHAYAASGGQASGFPAFTSGWTVFAPSTGDLFGTGRTQLVSTTREGYLVVWNTSGRSAGNDEWWRWQHDEHNSGRYGTATRPPGAVRQLHWFPGATAASFVAPGDVGYASGQPAAYRVRLAPSGQVVTVAATAAAGAVQRIQIPRGTWWITVQAVGSTGLLSLPAHPF